MIVHTIFIVHQTRSFVSQRFVGHACGIELFWFVVLTHRISHPVFAQIDAAHIGITYKLDTIEIIRFAFVDVGNIIPSAYAGQYRIHSVCCLNLIAFASACFWIFQIIYYAEAFFSPVHTSEAFQEGESRLIICFNSLAEIILCQFYQIQRIFCWSCWGSGYWFSHSGFFHFWYNSIGRFGNFCFCFRLYCCIFFYIFHSLSLLQFV